MSEIVVHHLEVSRSFRVLWLLEELGEKYKIQHYKRDTKASNGPQQLRKIHPLGERLTESLNIQILRECGTCLRDSHVHQRRCLKLWGPILTNHTRPLVNILLLSFCSNCFFPMVATRVLILPEIFLSLCRQVAAHHRR